MPVCFQLYDKTKPGEGPVVLQEVDRLMCLHFEQPCDPVRYLAGWYDCIGFRLACGKSFEEVREQLRGYVEEDTQAGNMPRAKFYETMLLILAWLEEHYDTSSFYANKEHLEGY